MSQRREKRIRQLERRIMRLETQAAAGTLEANLRQTLVQREQQPVDAWWERSPYTSIYDAPAAHTTQRKSLFQRIIGFFKGA